MKKYQIVLVPASRYRNLITPGIYMGKRPYDKAETVLMLNKDDPTTFVMRVLTNDEFKRLHDTGKNASEQIGAIILILESIKTMFETFDECLLYGIKEDQNDKVSEL